MRRNIEDIMKAVKCDEQSANKIETYIDRYIGLDWSESTARQVAKAAREAAKEVGIKASK